MISSFCNWGECVQVDPAPGGGVYIRRRVTGDGASAGQLPFTAAEFWAFVQGVKNGDFDHLVQAPPTPQTVTRILGADR